MSKQLAISTAFSIFAMSAFVLLGTSEVAPAATVQAMADKATGVEAMASTPVAEYSYLRLMPKLSG